MSIYINSWSDKLDNLLSNIKIEQNPGTLQTWNLLAKSILNQPISDTNWVGFSNKKFLQGLEPLENEVSQVASIILKQESVNENHAALARKIKALEQFHATSQDPEVASYCNALTNECIALLKEEHKAALERKISLSGIEEVLKQDPQKQISADLHKLKKLIKGIQGKMSEENFTRLKNRIDQFNGKLTQSQHQSLALAFSNNKQIGIEFLELESPQNKELETLIKNLKLKPATPLTDDQYRTLAQDFEKLDNFFTQFEKFSKIPLKYKNECKLIDESIFLTTWMAVMTGYEHKPPDHPYKSDRNSRIDTLQSINKMELPKELTENLDPIKASLNFILAMAMLAKELNRSSPNEDIIKNAYELLKKSAEFSKPAEIASNLSLDDWKKLSLNKETLEQTHQAILNEIKEGGFEQFVSKKDINDVFKILKDPNARIKGKIIKCLKIIAAILTLPIALSLTFLFVSSFIFFLATVPLWMGLGYLIYKWREHESQKNLEEYLKQDMSTI